MAVAKRKKRFFEVEMPVIKKNTHLFAYEKKELEGRIIKYDLTRLLRGKNIVLDLKVILDGEKITSTPTGFILLQAFIKRMIRKGTDYVEDSFSTDCRNARITIKPFLITRRKVSRRIKNAVSKKAREEIIKWAGTKNYEELFDDCFKNNIQKELSIKIKKIYPLSLCEIRHLKIEKIINKKEEAKKE